MAVQGVAPYDSMYVNRKADADQSDLPPIFWVVSDLFRRRGRRGQDGRKEGLESLTRPALPADVQYLNSALLTAAVLLAGAGHTCSNIAAGRRAYLASRIAELKYDIGMIAKAEHG